RRDHRFFHKFSSRYWSHTQHLLSVYFVVVNRFDITIGAAPVLFTPVHRGSIALALDFLPRRYSRVRTCSLGELRDFDAARLRENRFCSGFISSTLFLSGST